MAVIVVEQDRDDSTELPLGNAASTDVPALRIELLGKFRVSTGSTPIDESEWYLRKAKSLIKLLALADKHRMHRGEIMDLLWPDLEPSAAANNLHKLLYVARRVIEPTLPPKAASHFLQLHGDLVILNHANVWIDVVEFRTMAERAQTTHDITALQEALSLYSGDLLPEDRYEEWTIHPRDDLRHLHITLLLALAEVHACRGESGAAIDVLRHVIGIDHANEQAHVALMRLLASTGQRQAALRQYALLRDALFQELNVEPDAGAQKLYSDILGDRYVPDQVVPSNVVEVIHHDVSRHLVGRDDVLTRMRAHLDSLFDGRGSMVLLHGHAGMGKSSLAAQIEREAVQRDALSLWGAAYKDEQHIPYGALGRMIEGFALRVGAQTLRALADVHASELASLAPAFLRVLPSDQHTQVADVLQDEERMVAALIQFLTALSTYAPLVVTLEDLHWADRSTIHFLESVSHLMPETRILFLCNFRSEEPRMQDSLRRLFAAASSGRGVESVEVQPLSDAEIGALAVRLLGAPIADDVRDIICRIAQGSPYYAEEAIGALRGRRRIEPVNGLWTIRKGIRLSWTRNDLRGLLDGVGDFQVVRKLRTV